MSGSPFSREEKAFLKKLKERAETTPEEVESFLEKVLQEIATGKSLMQWGGP